MAIVGFPNPVDEVSTRLVAGFVVALSVVTVLVQWKWGTALIAAGFLLRVISGPKLSPLGQLVTKVIRPRLAIEPRECPGPPKRFAQAIGFVFSGTAAVLWIGFGLSTAATVVMAGLIFAASLEAFVGLCLGCKAFGLLMALGVIPEPVCERCASVGAGRAA
jgi:hypothetical protein